MLRGEKGITDPCNREAIDGMITDLLGEVGHDRRLEEFCEKIETQ